MTRPDQLATPPTERAVAPDLARGVMLLLIALANIHLYSYGHGVGARGYPRDIDGVDRLVAVVQLLLVDGRAYPMFAFLFGYGVIQLARRRSSTGEEATAKRLVRRRGGWLVLFGAVHGLLLFSGDIIAAYGVLGVLLAGLPVCWSPARTGRWSAAPSSVHC